MPTLVRQGPCFFLSMLFSEKLGVLLANLGSEFGIMLVGRGGLQSFLIVDLGQKQVAAGGVLMGLFKQGGSRHVGAGGVVIVFWFCAGAGIRICLMLLLRLDLH